MLCGDRYHVLQPTPSVCTVFDLISKTNPGHLCMALQMHMYRHGGSQQAAKQPATSQQAAASDTQILMH
eukprot:10654774-Karenia_brevis.AAC.1